MGEIDNGWLDHGSVLFRRLRLTVGLQELADSYECQALLCAASVPRSGFVVPERSRQPRNTRFNWSGAVRVSAQSA